MITYNKEGPARRKPFEPAYLGPEVSRETFEDRPSRAKERRIPK